MLKVYSKETSYFCSADWAWRILRKGTKINNSLILYKFTFKVIAQGWHAARWAQGINATATL